MAPQVDKWGDGLGMPIDSGIKETVIILNLLGVKTSSSCEGHIDRGLPYPWINLDNNKDSRFVWEKINKVQKQIRELQESNNKENSQELFAQNRYLFSQLEQSSQNVITPIYSLLEKFYDQKNIKYDTILQFSFKSFPRMHSLGVNRQDVRSPDEKKNKLKEYQDEMNDFTDFLLGEYLEK